MEDTSSDEEGMLNNATNTSKRQRSESLYESSEENGADDKLSATNHKALQSRKNNQVEESLDNAWKQLDDNLTEMTNGDENDGEKAAQTPKSSSSSGTQLTAPSSIHPKFYSALDQTRELLLTGTVSACLGLWTACCRCVGSRVKGIQAAEAGPSRAD